MHQSSFAFSPMTLRSLRLEEDLLEMQGHKKRLAATYLLKKEARERGASRAGRALAPATCHDLVVQNALYTGNVEAVQRYFPRGATVDLIVEPRGGDMRWEATGEGLWSLTYEQELTTPLHITAGRGFTECLRHLLFRGADVELSPGGCTALHEACEEGRDESAALLLSYGADANAMSEDGLAPLHVCSTAGSLNCAKHLLQSGADVNVRSLEEDDTPLHVAARYGLPEHVELYLHHGASLDRQNDEGHTPLNAACAQPQECRDLDRYHRVCRLLVEAGADVCVGDRDKQSPLHMACKTVNPGVVELLLEHGASVNDMCYSSDTPMHNVLKVVNYKAGHGPERVVRSLLNHGSIRVWPGALPKILKHCCASPRTIEVLLNTYDRVKITDSWLEAVPPEIFQEHKGFFESVFSLAQTPRSLQHLARCKIRKFLEGRLHKAVPALDLPTFIRNYLLLEFRDYVH